MRNLKRIKLESAKQRRTVVSGNGYIKKHLEFIVKGIIENDIDFMEIKRVRSRQITEALKDKTLIVKLPGNISVNLFVNNIRNLLKRESNIHIEYIAGNDRAGLKSIGYKRDRIFDWNKNRGGDDDDGTGTASRNGKRYKIIR